MKEKIEKEQASAAPDHVSAFVEEMKVNRMYELPANPDFKWAMIEHNEFGYCWTIGFKGMCTNIYSTDVANNIQYRSTEAQAKSDLTEKIRENKRQL